jgi:hypothetical protein
MTPVQAGKMKGEIKKRWNSFRETAIRNQYV